ncbi:hypothetical protein ACLOJK_037688 [Asimina triloba]
MFRDSRETTPHWGTPVEWRERLPEVLEASSGTTGNLRVNPSSAATAEQSEEAREGDGSCTLVKRPKEAPAGGESPPSKRRHLVRAGIALTREETLQPGNEVSPEEGPQVVVINVKEEALSLRVGQK